MQFKILQEQHKSGIPPPPAFTDSLLSGMCMYRILDWNWLTQDRLHGRAFARSTEGRAYRIMRQN